MTEAGTIVLMAVGVVAFLLVLFLASMPGSVARERRHPSAEAINICGWLGLLFLPCWFVAIVWAYAGPAPARRNPYRPPTGKSEWPDELAEKENA